MPDDQFTREALMIRIDRMPNCIDVVDALMDLFILRGPPAFIRSENGPEFVTERMRDWITNVGAQIAFIEPGLPWENGDCESSNARLRDELLNGEIFQTLKEPKMVIDDWRRHYSTVRSHSSLGGKPPAPEAIDSMDQRTAMHQQFTRAAHGALLTQLFPNGREGPLKSL